jgi:D-aspartate ligase
MDHAPVTPAALRAVPSDSSKTSGDRSVLAGMPPALLTMPGYHGTLAAVRNLGRNGIPVTTVDPARLATGTWSKYATRFERCPPVRDTSRFLEWLLSFGRSNERHVLLPTCDDTGFLYALHRAELSEHFFLAAPDVKVVHALLDKRQLMEHARAVGLDTPRSWVPSSRAEVEALARDATFPLLIKPSTQVLYNTRVKGMLVHERARLLEAYEKVAGDGYGQSLRDYDASITRPIVQEFFADAVTTGIYSVCGHARDGQVIGARAMRKVLQWPRRLGVGVCFEAAPLEQALVDGLSRLIARVGYHGTFEAEFVQDGERRLLIDFNPRFYNQMGFDVARGLPLPLLAYRDAIGEPLSLPSEGNDAGPIRGYAHGAALQLLLRSQRLSGALSRQELEHWLGWLESEPRVDAVLDDEDPMPALFDKVNLARDVARHPLRFMRVIALNRT